MLSELPTSFQLLPLIQLLTDITGSIHDCTALGGCHFILGPKLTQGTRSKCRYVYASAQSLRLPPVYDVIG